MMDCSFAEDVAGVITGLYNLQLAMLRTRPDEAIYSTSVYITDTVVFIITELHNLIFVIFMF